VNNPRKEKGCREQPAQGETDHAKQTVG
jgi:hypothetical protein